MHILSVGRAKPPHYYDQDQLVAALEQAWTKQHHNVRDGFLLEGANSESSASSKSRLAQ